jgi:hypothetical protein
LQLLFKEVAQMENIQEMKNQTSETSRRKFLTDSAKKAAWAAPALTLMMTASATPARATYKYGEAQCNKYGEAQTLRYGGAKKPKNGFQFWKLWHKVHRGR